jgi:hypothetical protein
MGFVNHVPSLPRAEKGQVNKRKDAKSGIRISFSQPLEMLSAILFGSDRKNIEPMSLTILLPISTI